jgi:hypothetical protein
VPAASLGTAGTESAGTIGAESANRLAGIQGPDGQLHLWRITSATDAVQVGSIPGAPVPAGIDPDSQTAFQVTGNKIQWWDISNPAHPVRQGTSVLPGSGSLVNAITAGNLLVATTTIDSGSSLALNTSNLVLFDVAQGRVRSTATLSTTAGAELEVSPDHHLLAVASGGGGAVTLWDISDPRHPRSLSTVPAQLDVQGIEFSPDSKVLAVSSQGTVQLWDTTTHRSQRRQVRSPACSAGTPVVIPVSARWITPYLAWPFRDRAIRLPSPQTRRPPCSIATPPRSLPNCADTPASRSAPRNGSRTRQTCRTGGRAREAEISPLRTASAHAVAERGAEALRRKVPVKGCRDARQSRPPTTAPGRGWVIAAMISQIHCEACSGDTARPSPRPRGLRANRSVCSGP